MKATHSAQSRGGAALGAALFAATLVAALYSAPPLTAPAHAQGGGPPPPRPGGPRGDRPRPGDDNKPKDPAHALLRRMVDAEMHQTYLAREATFSAEGPGTEQWVKHDPHRGIRRESIRPPGPIFIDNFKKLWRTMRPNTPFVESNSLLTRKDGRRMQDFGKRMKNRSLTVQIVGQDRVAGRNTDIVMVAGPQGTSGPYRRFWVDRDTGLRLRTEEVGPQGRVLSGSYYLSLDLNADFQDADFQPPTGAKIVKEDHKRFPTLEAAAKAGFAPRVPNYLPPGFALQAVDVTRNGKLITQRYANGVNFISLAESKEDLSERHKPPQFSNVNNERADYFSLPRGQRGHIWRADDRFYFLIGPFPDQELKRIADSVR